MTQRPPIRAAPRTKEPYSCAIPPPRLAAWLILASLATPVAAADAPAATPSEAIPFSALGARVDQQQGRPTPTLADDRATLGAPLQALSAEIGPEGLAVDSTSQREGTGRFQLTPVSLDKGAEPLPLTAGQLRLAGETLILERGALREQFSASGDGLRQDFIVPAPPAGDQPLRLTLALRGATAAQAGPNIALTLPGGRELRYHGLHITDADGRVLTGTLAACDAHTLLIRVADTGARYPLTIDPTITDADWQSMNRESLYANARILAFAYDATNNRLYIGGDFTSVGTSVSASRVASWDGSAWSALGSGLNNGVAALAVAADGSLYAGGWFTDGGGNANADRIARWDGTNWLALGTGMNAEVRALAISSTGTLYVGGAFTSAGGVADTTRIAAWDGTSWSPLSTGLDNVVFALAADASGGVYAGGDFSNAGGVAAADRIAHWDGSAWAALGPEGWTDGVLALVLDGTDLYAGGWFTTAGTVPANHIARWNGGTWSALGAGVDGVVDSLKLSGSALYVGGRFSNAGGSAASRIARWDTSGETWSALGAGANNNVLTLAVIDGTLYAGGDFTSAGGNAVGYIARWDGSAWLAAGIGGSFSSAVYALAVSGGDLYAGGIFTQIGTTTVNRIAHWDGSGWSALGSGMNDAVFALAVSGSDLYAGGFFTTAGGNSASNIARWDGSNWSALGSGMSSTVWTLAISGNDLYAGGDFSTAGGISASRIARWNLDDEAWYPLGSGVNSSVRALATSGTDLYVGGFFTTAGGNAYPYLASLNQPPCGFGIPYSAAAWQMLSLPCTPDGEGDGSVAGTFGDDTSTALPTASYGVASTGWAIFDRSVGATPAYDMLASTDTLATGAGYWLKSYVAPPSGKLQLEGSATPITLGNGCASANGCVAVTVSTVSGDNRYNLVGNPFPYAIDWADVRIRVGGAAGTIYTPSQAAGVAASGNADPAVLSNQIWIWIWNGNSYDTYDDATPGMTGQLRYFNAFWVNVLPDAFGQTVELLIPALRSDGAQAAPARTDDPWYLAWLDWLIPAARADADAIQPGRGPEERPALGWARRPAQTPVAPIDNPELELMVVDGQWRDGLSEAEARAQAHRQAIAEGREWSLRLKVDEPATGFKDHNNRLGQLLDAADGADAHDLIELPPYSRPYLTLVFPRPKWGARAGDYASDFHAATGERKTTPEIRSLQNAFRELRTWRDIQLWNLEIRGDRPGAKVLLSWDATPEVLARSALIDSTRHRLYDRLERAQLREGLPVTLDRGGRAAFIWVYRGAR